MRRSLQACAIVVLVGVVSVGCAQTRSSTGDEPSHDSGLAGHGSQFFEQTKAASEAASYLPQPFVTLEDLLPNHLYVAMEANTEAQPITHAIVVGEVVDVNPGFGFPMMVPDDGQDHRLDFGAPEAAWSSATADIAVKEEIATEDGARLPNNIRIGVRVLPVSGSEGDWKYDFDSYKESLLSSGEALFVLEETPSAFSYDPELFGLFMNGEWWCSVRGDQLRFPAVEENVAEARLKEVDTLSELRASAQQSQSVTEVTQLEASWLSD